MSPTAPLKYLLPLLAVGLSACGDREAAASGGGQGRGAALATPVETGIVELGTIARSATVSGTVEPIRTIGVNSQLSGAVLSVEVEEGTRVRAGQVLARMDDRELAAQQESAEAAFAVAEAAFRRAEQLRERQVITINEYERDRTAYAAARAQLDQLRTRRGYAVVRSPLDGVVLQKRVEAGDIVGNQTQLFSIGDVSTLVVRVPVSELDVVELTQGEPASMVFDAIPQQSFSGRIRRVFPSADPNSRLVPVEVALESAAASVARPGFLARVTFALGERAGVRLIPAGAVIASTGGQGVFKLEGGRAMRHAVQTGLTSGGMVEVLGGLEAGDTIVVAGGNILRDGGEVRVVAGPAPSAGGEANDSASGSTEGGAS